MRSLIEPSSLEETPHETGYSNQAFELTIADFAREGSNGGKGGSRKYHGQWNVDEHKLSISSLTSRYETSVTKGLSTAQVSLNRTKFGENVVQPLPEESEVVKFLKNLLLGLNLFLWVAGLISIGAGVSQYINDPTDYDDFLGSLYSGMALILVVIVAGSFAYYQEYQSTKILQSFKNLMPQHAMVVRNYQKVRIEASDLVLGDLVELKSGDKIPADMRIVNCHSFKVDNSSITGESEPVSRTALCTDKDPLETSNIVLSSTTVTNGTATGIVVRVGEGTFMGQMVALASSVESHETAISKEIRQIILILTVMSVCFGLMFFALGLSMKYTWTEALFFVIGIVVANVPENLNVTITIILALAAKKMSKKNCLVKNLQAVETLGSASVICSDKTGTLTQNCMSVAHLWFNDTLVTRDDFSRCGSHTGFTQLAVVASLCNNATFLDTNKNVPMRMRNGEGNSTDVAILRLLEEHFSDVSKLRGQFPKVFEIPFSSSNRHQLSVHTTKDSTSKTRYFATMKGAPEEILERCDSILLEGEARELNEDIRRRIQDAYLNLASTGERVLGFCDCSLSSKTYHELHTFTDEDAKSLIGEKFRFVGFMSMLDPPRPAVPEAVLKCRVAGIKIAMITGDHPATATAIARSVNIISPDSIIIGGQMGTRSPHDLLNIHKIGNAAVVTGHELCRFSPEELQCLLSLHEEIVFARTTPQQKYDVVRAYQNLGHVVAVTGDGVNDAPALKTADLGIAMGSGTDVAKEVADMILLDDNFASITQGIEDGRLIFDNLKKLLRFTMADNVAEMYCYWVFIVLRIPLPMGTIAMLLSTLAIDVFPAVSLAYEPGESDIMKIRPRNPKEDTLMTVQMLSYSYGQVAVIETLSGFLAYFVTFACYGWLPKDLIFNRDKFESTAINDLVDSYGQEWSHKSRRLLETQAQTAFFIAIVLCQFANAICCKTRRISAFHHTERNPRMNAGLLMMVLAGCLFVFTPAINTAVQLVPLISYESWVAALPFAVLLFIYDEIRKFAVRCTTDSWIFREFNT